MKEFLKRHKKLFLTLSVVILVAAIAVIQTGRMKSRRDAMMAAAPSQETAQVEKRTLVDSISATGTVVSAGSKNVKTDVTGVKVESVNVEVGDRVEEGDVLCILDSESIEEKLADARTTLSATSGKTQIDLSSSERSLNEAQTSRNIEVERANADVADAWNDYLEALTDLEEAESDYNNAKQETAEKNGEYEYRLELLEEAKNKMNASAVGTSSSAYEEEFNRTKAKLKSYISGDSTYGDYDVDSWIYLTADLTNISADTFSGTSSNPSPSPTASPSVTADEINKYLETLRNLQSLYNTSVSAEGSYQQAKAEYEALSAEVSSWQNKYQTAKSGESSYEAAYENAVTAADSKLDAYNQKVRSKEDTVRNSDSTVSSREDSLATSKLNATTSGLTDKQTIRQYEDQIEECTVTAPMSGIITELNVEAGDTYSGSVIATIEDTSSYEISAEIDEYDISKVKEGQQVVIRTNGTGDAELDGTVKEIAPRASSGTTDVSYAVTVSVDTPCDDLRLDMTAKLSIILESKDNVLTVPYDSVQEDEDGGFYIEVIRETAAGADAEEESASGQMPERDNTSGQMPGKENAPEQMPERESTSGRMPEKEDAPAQLTEKIKITKGIESDYYIEIIGSGIEEGMKVVVPASSDAGNDIQMMIGNRGPMGGF